MPVKEVNDCVMLPLLFSLHIPNFCNFSRLACAIVKVNVGKNDGRLSIMFIAQKYMAGLAMKIKSLKMIAGAPYC